MSETITCTGCGGERRMTDDQIDVPENGLCAMELDSCPSDQELLMSGEGFECPVCSIWNPPSADGIGAHLRCDCDYDWDANGNLVVGQ